MQDEARGEMAGGWNDTGGVGARRERPGALTCASCWPIQQRPSRQHEGADATTLATLVLSPPSHHPPERRRVFKLARRRRDARLSVATVDQQL